MKICKLNANVGELFEFYIYLLKQHIEIWSVIIRIITKGISFSFFLKKSNPDKLKKRYLYQYLGCLWQCYVCWMSSTMRYVRLLYLVARCMI